MQAQTNVFPVQTQLVGQTQVVGQTRVAPVQTNTTTQQSKASNNDAGGIEIALRVICTPFSLGVLIAASFAISAINEVEDLFDPSASDVYGFDADSYRGAAGWLIFVASTAILYHIAMIIVRCLYMNSVIEKHLTIYRVINYIVIVLFGLSFLSGGIANVVYAADNGDLRSDLCRGFGGPGSEICSALDRVVATEAASGGLSIFTMFLYMGTVCIIICISMVDTSLSPRINYRAQCVPSAYPSVDPSQYITPSAPNYPPANVPPSVAVSSHVTPSAPIQPAANTPWYASGEPPPYEIALTLRKEYQHKPSSSDPPNQ